MIACIEGDCITVPERFCNMLDKACFVFEGTNVPIGSNLVPPKEVYVLNMVNKQRGIYRCKILVQQVKEESSIRLH